MILTKYHVSCDVCHVATLEIKTNNIYKAADEIKEAGWTTIAPYADEGVVSNNPYLARHSCLGCQAKAAIKSHERRGENVETDK